MKHLQSFESFDFFLEANTADSDFKKATQTKVLKNPAEDQTRAVASTTSYHRNDPTISKQNIRPGHNAAEMGSVDWDSLVDVVSLACEGVPGIGTVVSAGIDLTHALSYFVRWFFTKVEDEKIEYVLMGGITFIGTAIPGFGNTANIIARGGIKNVLKQTPSSIIKLAQQMGVLKKPIIDLMKTDRWKYCLALLLGKLMGYDLIQKLGAKLKELSKINFKDLMIQKAYNAFISGLSEIFGFLKATHELSQKFPNQF